MLTNKIVIKCITYTDESLNFGIKTLEEIRLGKALKASLNRPGKIIVTCIEVITVKSDSVHVFLWFFVYFIFRSSLFARL